MDLAPAEVYATLLDEGSTSAPSARCIASWPRTREVRERRDQLRHPVYAAPELLARRPNELWSWDITKLLGPAKWTYFYLYVMLDVFSRYVVGWMVAHRESATLAEQFIARDVRPRRASTAASSPSTPTAGSAMTSKPVALLLADLGVTKTHSPAARLQRQPVLGGAVQDAEVPAGLPGALRLDPGCPRPLPRLLPLVQHRAPSQRPRPADARTTCTHGLAEQRVAARATVLATAYAAHPERFPAGLPHPPARPVEVWINPPKIPAPLQTSPANLPSPLAHAAPSPSLSAIAAPWEARRG